MLSSMRGLPWVVDGSLSGDDRGPSGTGSLRLTHDSALLGKIGANKSQLGSPFVQVAGGPGAGSSIAASAIRLTGTIRGASLQLILVLVLGARRGRHRSREPPVERTLAMILEVGIRL